MWRGSLLFFDGHRRVEMGICIAYYSDDEGLSWRQCEGGLFGWFDERGVPNGEGGIIDVYEPTAAETKDGRVLMFMRSKTGRLLQSYSKDGGQTWDAAQSFTTIDNWTPPPDLAAKEDGTVYVTWRDDLDLYLARSVTGGSSWSPPALVVSDTMAPISFWDDERLSPALAVDAAGTIHLVWEQLSFDTFVSSDICYTRSGDGGENWNGRQCIGRPPTARVEMTDPDIIVDPASGRTQWEYAFRREEARGVGVGIRKILMGHP